MSRTIEASTLAGFSPIHDIPRTRSGAPVRDNSCNYVENWRKHVELYRELYGKSCPEVLADVQSNLASTDEEDQVILLYLNLPFEAKSVCDSACFCSGKLGECCIA